MPSFAEPAFIPSVLVLCIALWGMGAVILYTLQDIMREGERMKSAGVTPSNERRAISRQDVERWAIRLEADHRLPAGWTARDAARLLRIRARRRRLLLEEDHH